MPQQVREAGTAKEDCLKELGKAASFAFLLACFLSILLAACSESGKSQNGAPVTPTTTTEPTRLPTSTSEPAPPSPTPPMVETPETTAQPANFEQIKTLIENAQGSQQKKAEALQLLENLKEVQGVLNQFETAYEAQTEPDGTPTLLALTVESLDHLDPSPLYPGLTPEEARIEWAKDNIFYLKDDKELKDCLQEASKYQDLPTIIDKLKMLTLLGIDLNIYQYLQVDSQKGHSYQIETIEPGVVVDPEKMEKITETLDKMAIPGNVIVRLSTKAINTQKYGVPLSTAYYEDLGSPAAMSIITDDDLSLVIEGVYLEAGHLLQVSAEPYKYIKYLSPEEFVQLQIEELQALGPQRMAILLAPLGPEDYKNQSASEIMRDAQDFISEQFSVMIADKALDPTTLAYKYLEDLRTYLNN